MKNLTKQLVPWELNFNQTLPSLFRENKAVSLGPEIKCKCILVELPNSPSLSLHS